MHLFRQVPPQKIHNRFVGCALLLAILTLTSCNATDGVPPSVASHSELLQPSLVENSTTAGHPVTVPGEMAEEVSRAKAYAEKAATEADRAKAEADRAKAEADKTSSALSATLTDALHSLDVNLDFVLDGITKGQYDSTNLYRYATKNILCLDFDVVLKQSPENRMALITYSDASGTDLTDCGWVTDSSDYTVSAGTFFRVLVMAESYAEEAELRMSHAEQYRTKRYQSIALCPAMLDGVNLLHTGRTVSRISGIDTPSKKPPTAGPEIKAINHRGWNTDAPENTLPAIEGQRKTALTLLNAISDGRQTAFPCFFTMKASTEPRETQMAPTSRTR